MRPVPLRVLTWGTVAAAVSSAVWLSSTNQGGILCLIGYPATSRAIGVDVPLPAAPTGAGPSSPTGSSAPPFRRTP